MTIKDITKLMAQSEQAVSAYATRTMHKIISLAKEYDLLGERFTFNANADLDREVKRLLVQLSDTILDYAKKKASSTVYEEDEDEAVIYINRTVNGKSLTQRTDSHTSHLKYLLEGYLAVCFADGLSEGDIRGGLFRFLESPNTYPPMQDAFKQSDKYLAAGIVARGFHFGKGEITNPIKAIAILVSNAINEAFQFGKIRDYDRQGAIGYTVHRGSSFDCPECDANLGKVFPLDMQVLPVHPRCCCYTEPVFGMTKI